MRHARVVCVLTLALAGIAAAADAPYFGKWKVNSAKTQVTGMAAIEKQPSGDYRFDQDGFIYNFKPDGKEYPMPDGGAASWKMVDDNNWEVTMRANGKVTATVKLTASGDTLTSAVTIPQADGKTLTESGTSKRISGGPGVLGKWRATKTDADDIWLEVTPEGADGLRMAQPNSLCVAQFDGKPFPMSGPGDPPKQTMAFRRKGPASFEALTYVDGKLFFTDVFSVSADGKVLTDIGTPVATKKPAKVIFDRQ
jgi:hypothetical protein